MIRRFKLINSNSVEWELTDKDFKVFLNEPDGFGLSNTLEVVRYGESAKAISQQFEFPNPSGTLLFYDSDNEDRYEKYFDFCRFISYAPLKLRYYISENDYYTLECYVTGLDKTETDTDGIMYCDVDFQGLSFWEGTRQGAGGNSDSYTLTNDGDFPIGFTITIRGSLKNPYFTLEQDGEIYGEAKFIDTNVFSSVYVNSKDGEQSIVLKQNNIDVTNPLNYQDFSILNGSMYVTFIKLARGQSTLRIGMDSGTISNAYTEFNPMYRSV